MLTHIFKVTLARCTIHHLYHPSKFQSQRSYCVLKEASPRIITNVKEFNIPVLYGNLAAKAWGKESGKPVLAIHGWLDNCGTFDKLAPLLDNNFYIVSIDGPGQGMSSHKPSGCLYSAMHDLLDYRKAIDFLGWTKFDIVGYSSGAAMGFLFSSIFPHLVKKMVAIDFIKCFSSPLCDFPELSNKDFHEYFNIVNKRKEIDQVLSYEELRSRYLGRLYDKISMESLNVLLKRSIRSSDCGRGVTFSRDLRASYAKKINLMSHELMYRYLSGVKCEILITWAKGADSYYQTDHLDVMENVLDIYRKHSKRFVVKYVEGNHFLLLDSPEILAPLINNFLNY